MDQIRKPQQKRSKETKEKILDAAYRLFCRDGYYNTTTNDIARAADVSIGSLYSYFKNKDTILLEILDRHNASFTKVYRELCADLNACLSEPKAWLRNFLEGLIRVHLSTKEFSREQTILSYSKPEVAAVLNEQQKITLGEMRNYFESSKQYLRVSDPDAAVIVTFHMISSIVDQIVYGNNNMETERILSEGVDAVYKYLMG